MYTFAVPLVATLTAVTAAALACAGCTYDATGNGGRSGGRGGGDDDDSTYVDSTKFVDSRDQKIYNKVTIGAQVWMAENLNYDVPDNTTDVCYGNRAGNCAEYGRLYDWGTSMGLEGSYYGTVWSGSDVKRQGVCPVGWHLPSNAEWNTLTSFVGSNAGTKLKSSTSYSGVPFGGTDEYGFSALPGGNGSSGDYFNEAGHNGYWWSATENNAYYAYYRVMNYYSELVNMDYLNKNYKFSVRCVQD